MRRAVKLLLVFAAALSLAACGFHLRGKADLPPQMAQTHIEGIQTHDGLGRELALMLGMNGVEVVSTSDSASAILAVTRTDFRQRVLTVDASANAREYELALTVGFRVRGHGNDFELAAQTITVTRTLLHEATDVLGNADERAVLAEDMQRDLARLILYRLSAAR